MPLNPTGPISLGGNTLGESVALQLGLSPTGPISLDDTAVRALAEVPTGAITMPDNFWGKPSGGFTFTPTITSNINNYNLINEAIAAGWNGTSSLTANVTVNAGVTIGSTSASTAAFLIGSLPAGSIVTLTNNGTIVGKGGNGGSANPAPGTVGSAGGGGAGTLVGLAGTPPTLIGTAGNNGTSTTGGTGGARVVYTQGVSGPQPNANINGLNGENGGVGLLTNYATIVINNGTIAGGGGGGGSGSGTIRFITPGGAPTLVITSGFGGNGGNLGQPGTAGETIVAGFAVGGNGGAAGNAINGTQPVTLSGSGTLIGPSTGVVFTTTIASNTNNYNLINAATAAGWDGVSVLNANVTINPGVTIGSTSASTAAFLIGSLPAGSTVTVTNNGTIVGKGGNGGNADQSGACGCGGGGGAGTLVGSGGLQAILRGLPGNSGTSTTGGAGGTGSISLGTNFSASYEVQNGALGEKGGDAILTLHSVNLINNGLIIGAGGGGGGGGGYAVTIGFNPSTGRYALELNAGTGGDGGNLGLPGTAGATVTKGSFTGTGGAGGAAGYSINGYSLVTLSGSGSLTGPTI